MHAIRDDPSRCIAMTAADGMPRLLRDDLSHNGAVHVWQATLHAGTELVDRYWEVLSDVERERSERLRFTPHRQQFVVSHGVLRHLLASYTGLLPQRIRFGFSAQGKPELKEAFGLQFNMAHSRDVALYALTHQRRVGIDVESVEPVPDMLAVASTFLSADEYAAMLALPTELQTAAFYACWTKKEAYVKARAVGLSLDLRSFSVSLEPAQRTVVPTIDRGWSAPYGVQAIEVEGSHCAALSVEGANARPSLFQWRHEWVLSEG